MKSLTQNPSRRDVLKWTTVAGLAACIRPARAKWPVDNPKSFLTDIGVCAPLASADLAAKSGCTYIEEGVRRFLVPEESDDAFGAKLAELRASKLPVPACNVFLPGSLKCVGPEAKHEAILSYSETAFLRAQKAGTTLVVFGSGESRRIPDGFDRKKAGEQFMNLCIRMSPLAEKYGVTVALEHLNRTETNTINSLAEGLEMVDRVHHPRFQMLADFYHMLKEDEKPEIVVTGGKRIVHCHLAEKEKRTPPGIAGDDFKPYLRALKKIGYRGKLSLECRWDNFDAQLSPAVTALKRQISEVV